MFKQSWVAVVWLILLGWLGTSSCARRPSPATSWKGYTERGQASYYADKFQGKKMANGRPYRRGKLTAAHQKIPLGSRVRVTNPKNRKSVKVEITDRGPHTKNRILDLSRAAAEKLDVVTAGVAPVKIKVLKPKKEKSR